MPPRSFLTAVVFALLQTGRSSAEEKKPSFEQDVRPVLKAYCLDCHGGGEKPKGKLDLRLRRLVVQGGTSGPAIVPGDPA